MSEVSPESTPDTSSTPVPNQAPGRVEIEDGVAWIHLDDPTKNVNTLSTRYFRWFEEQIDELANQPLRGMVFLSDKPGYFIVGADIEELEAFQDKQEVLDLIRRGHRLVMRFADLPYPVVAAIDGACMGGGLELSLACDYRLCTNASHTKLGLPEVKLGLYPGLGGTQRLPRLIGVTAALDLILTGKDVGHYKAKKIGLVDETCHPEVLKQAALELVTRGKPKRDLRGKMKLTGHGGGFVGFATDLLSRAPGTKNLIFDKARDQVLKRSGGHYPAPLKAIEVVKEGIAVDLDQALEMEARGFADLVVTDVAKGLISIFFTKNEVEGRSKDMAATARNVDRVAVVGAGFMGAGIAQGLSYRNYEVVLKDRDHVALARGLRQCNDLFGNLAKRRKITKVDQKIAMSRILPTVDYAGFEKIPFVVEAVFEDVDIKHAVIRQVEECGPPDLIFASNTSTIPIARLAEASQRPENFVGMHFFSPVHKMPLLEIIRTDQTSDETLATTIDIGRKMGKTIIVVNDGPGFFTSRVLGPFVNEALYLLHQGARIEQIDKVVAGWGWPVGPIALLDEVGLDVAHHAGRVMLEYAGDRAQPSPVFDQMIDAGRTGRKGGRGFYDYSKKPKEVDESVYDLIGWEESPVSDQEIIERTWMQMLNETARCIEDGVISNPNDIDIGVIFGFGFPPFRGGILREADRQGLEYVVDRLETYAEKYGERLAPAQLLVDMAKRGESFHQD
ncbi:MAG: 3-hydroxyacyl-CoA dehydrogenase NAD-binding domain-containing protein [Thermoanaerobaculia bacterium]|nr:3-hydroxyacyl-CoA dehydrogenase NAD-binding domain-containing protein [Thermoanaerobaculia bacterium]